MNLEKFRKVQLLISSIIFIIVFICFIVLTNFKLTEIQLSYFGAKTNFNWIWNCSVILVSISSFLNINYYLDSIKNLNFKKGFKAFFFIICLSLFFTGLINMQFKIHNFMAFYYFFSYPVGIFFLAHLNHKTLSYSQWKGHLIFFLVLTITPILLLYMFNGMAFAEITHIIIILVWNYYILK